MNCPGCGRFMQQRKTKWGEGTGHFSCSNCGFDLDEPNKSFRNPPLVNEDAATD